MTDVLAIGPHPDDIEITAGGTVARLVSEGKQVAMVDLTNGERATRGTPELRREESRAAANALGVSSRESLDLPDAGVSARDPDHLARLVAVIRRHRPSLVLTLHWLDDHPDHIEGGDLVRRSVYLAGLRNYPSPDETPHRTERLLFAMGRRAFAPSLVVDVTEHYETKRQALAAYASQFHRDSDDPLVTPISDPEFMSLMESRDRVHGHSIGVRFGEPFFEQGPVAVHVGWPLVPGKTQ